MISMILENIKLKNILVQVNSINWNAHTFLILDNLC